MNRFVLLVLLKTYEEANGFMAHMVEQYNTVTANAKVPSIPGYVMVEGGPSDIIMLGAPPAWASESMLRMLVKEAERELNDGTTAQVHTLDASAARTWLMENGASFKRTEPLPPDLQAKVDKCKRKEFNA